MLNQVVDIFVGLGFEIQNTSFNHLTKDGEISYLRSIDLPDNEAASIIKYFPDLFVMHREINHKDGTLFVVLTDRDRSIPEKVQTIYKHFFPRKLMVVSRSKDNLYARWFHGSGKPEPLLLFIRKEVGVKSKKG